MTSAFRVSVVIPTFKREGPLRAALESLTKQQLSHGALEVVLADDGSEGELDRCAADFSSRFAGFQLVPGPNTGPGVARNRGVQAARGAIVIFMDSDCLATPTWAENMARAAEAHDGYVHGPVLSSVPPIPPYVHSFMIHDEMFCSGNFGLRRSIFVELGGFDPAISYIGEDHDFAERCRARGVSPLYVPDAVIMHPPRLNRIRFPTLDKRHYRALREFYRSNEVKREKLARDNRTLLRRGLLKLGGAVAPAILAPFFPPVWPLGLFTMLGRAFLHRNAANKQLQAAGESFSIPLGDALWNGLQMPFRDLALYTFLLKYDLGGLTKHAIDQALSGKERRAL